MMLILIKLKINRNNNVNNNLWYLLLKRMIIDLMILIINDYVLILVDIVHLVLLL
jgi:hypothetical protein